MPNGQGQGHEDTETEDATNNAKDLRKFGN